MHARFGQTFSLISSSLHIPSYVVMENSLTTLWTTESFLIPPHLGRLCTHLSEVSDFDLSDKSPSPVTLSA